MTSPLHKSAPHESAVGHVTGAARYVDDLPNPPGALMGLLLPSPHAHARILRRNADKARAMPGVRAVLFADDIPGRVLIGPIVHDEPLLATDAVHFRGQSVAFLVGESREQLRAAAAAVEVEYEPLPAIGTIPEAVAANSFLTEPHVIARGDPDAALAAAPLRLSGAVESGAQDHFYLETQAALCIPEEGGNFRIHSSTQHPTEVQFATAEVLGISSHRIIVDVPRMGGGFGGKESQATNYGALAALGALVTGCPVKVWLNRDEDMCWTGKRHPFRSEYEAGLDEQGRLLALRARVFSDGGWTWDLSGPVLDRALFHLDNAYFIPALRFEGRVCRTNRPSHTAFRGFGGPQGMLVVEEVLNRAAERLDMDPAEIRRRNYYEDASDNGSEGPRRNVAPYGQELDEIRLQVIHDALLESSDYERRRRDIAAFNATHPWTKRGLAFQPVKFGISFTKSFLNQAGALVLVYADGSVQLNHGGTEMGQGLHTKMIAVCAHELGIPAESVRVMTPSTEKVPNTSATAASSGSDLNGRAVQEACVVIRERMAPVASALLNHRADPADLRFEGGEVRAPNGSSVPFAEVAAQCRLQQVSLAATGYYRTPGIAYDQAAGEGTPFFYFAYGGAVIEAELNGLTGEHRLLRADILHDVGNPLVPSIDIGQVEGGFVQGAGWLTCEEVLFADDGRLLTHGPSTYKIPAYGDPPADFRVRLLERAPNSLVVGGSKAVGEPPFMLAIGVVTALRRAVQAFGRVGDEVELALPATPENLLRAVVSQQERAACADGPVAAESAGTPAPDAEAATP